MNDDFSKTRTQPLRTQSLRILSLALAFITSSAALPIAKAQTSTGAPPVSSDTIQETKEHQSEKQAKKGKVIFSRSIDENGNVIGPDGAKAPTPDPNSPPAPAPATGPAKTASAPGRLAMPGAKAHPPLPGSADALTADDLERQAPTLTDLDLDFRIRPDDSSIAVRALVAFRNDSRTPLNHLRLQLSSSLNWEQIRILGRPVQFSVAILNSDADHTGQLNEAAITLPAPLAPGATTQVDVVYSGTIGQTDKRLLAIGTPEDVAQHSDWDRISTSFTGLRGFGNVVWYPVSSVPVILGDGARLFDEIGSHKLQLTGAHFRMSLSIETSAANAPTIALINGHPVALAVTPGADASVATLVKARVEDSILGFEVPSIFLAARASHSAPNATLWARPESNNNVTAWINADTEVTPFLEGWLGKRPRSQLNILELPEDGDIPFESGAMLVTPIRAAPPEVLSGVMAHALTHAWVMSPRAWLGEGVAHFLGTVWTEKQQGRDRALAALDNSRPALAITEPESPGAGDGQPLVNCISPVYYRTKAAYVFWMLRELVGDQTLSAAFRAYDPAKDNAPDAFEKLVEQAGTRHDLRWFFNDWVYQDKGLPDLAIESVFSTIASVPGSYLAAVNLSNNGYAQVEAPVQVITDSTSVTQHILLPARSKVVQRILVQGIPTEVRLNDGTIPETQVTIHSKLIEAQPAR